jgi:hypothetical protein
MGWRLLRGFLAMQPVVQVQVAPHLLTEGQQEHNGKSLYGKLTESHERYKDKRKSTDGAWQRKAQLFFYNAHLPVLFNIDFFHILKGGAVDLHPHALHNIILADGGHFHILYLQLAILI